PRRGASRTGGAVGAGVRRLVRGGGRQRRRRRLRPERPPRRRRTPVVDAGAGVRPLPRRMERPAGVPRLHPTREEIAGRQRQRAASGSPVAPSPVPPLPVPLSP